MSDRVFGKVLWFDNKKGFGFAKSNSSNDDNEYFIHYSSINVDGYRTLRSKQNISFSIKQTDKGLQAVDIDIEK